MSDECDVGGCVVVRVVGRIGGFGDRGRRFGRGGKCEFVVVIGGFGVYYGDLMFKEGFVVNV